MKIGVAFVLVGAAILFVPWIHGPLGTESVWQDHDICSGPISATILETCSRITGEWGFGLLCVGLGVLRAITAGRRPPKPGP